MYKLIKLFYFSYYVVCFSANAHAGDKRLSLEYIIIISSSSSSLFA